MNKSVGMVRKWLLGAGLLGILLVLLANAGQWLVVDAPRPSDTILVLAGETDHRPERALQLLAQGYGRRVLIDVPSEARVFGFNEIQLAQKYVHGLPQASAVSVCPIEGLSTKDESKDAAGCLSRVGSKSVLIVTSDFHTRRALEVFRREVPQYDYSVAASRETTQFGTRWWTHRQWGKTFVDEWLRLIWWNVVDQWH